MKKEIFLFSSLLGLLGCGYSLVGTGSSALPATMKTVYVVSFINDTTVVGLEQRLTDQGLLIDQLGIKRLLASFANLQILPG